MSIPSIPGFTSPGTPSLGDLWKGPNDLPDGLWPGDALALVVRDPTEWLTVSEDYFTDERHGGRDCVLVPSGTLSESLEALPWIGRDLGEFAIWSTGEVDEGLAKTEGGIDTTYFAKGRRPTGAVDPVLEVHLPFLWYWDAFPTKHGWSYLNVAGRDQELVRLSFDEDGWRIEVRALELRNYLAACKRDAVIGVDVVTKIEHDPFERVDAEVSTSWARFDLYATHDGMLSRPAFSRVVGQYIVSATPTSRKPRMEEWHAEVEYPSFVYGVDQANGTPLQHSCDPESLGTYFDKDDSRIHYLTPVYFRREVLQPYAAEPLRYRISAHRLSCLNLWGVDISFNTVGLVELYLGDIGAKVPSDDWGHWRSYNVMPAGEMEEGRFRRDFLNQPASSPDLGGELQRGRTAAAQQSAALLGKPIWRKLDRLTAAQFESLIGPLADDATALGHPLLLLTKVFVDGIDPKPLKTALGDAQPNEGSLSLLRRWADSLGDEDDITRVLRELQAFRSQGGIAHLAGKSKAKAEANLEITGLSPLGAFSSIASRIVTALDQLGELMSAAATAS